MNCICGCGRRLGRRQVELNLLAGELAVELVVWDKARALRSPVAAEEVEEILLSGAPRYQALLTSIHSGGEPGEGEPGASREWLERSRAARWRLSEALPVLPKKKVDLSEADQQRVDRSHPERSFSGGGDAELDAVLAAGRGGDEDYERLAVAWLAHLIAERPPTLDELRWLLGRLEDVRAGRGDEAEPALRRFASDRS